MTVRQVLADVSRKRTRGCPQLDFVKSLGEDIEPCSTPVGGPMSLDVRNDWSRRRRRVGSTTVGSCLGYEVWESA